MTPPTPAPEPTELLKQMVEVMHEFCIFAGYLNIHGIRDGAELANISGPVPQQETIAGVKTIINNLANKARQALAAYEKAKPNA